MNPRLEAHATEMRSPQRREGFAKLPNSALLDFARLMSGNVQILSVLYINSENQWAGERRWTRAITHEELAKVTRTTVRAVELKVKDLIDRKVLQAKKTSKGTMYHIPFETWAELPDMPDPVTGVPVPVADAEAGEETPVKFAPAFKTRFKVEPGKRTKPIKLEQGAADQIQFDTNVPIECDGSFHQGILRLYITGQVQREQEAKPNRNIVRVARSQPTETTQPSKFDKLHGLLDDYCLHHHGTIPNEKLLSKIQAALGKATIEQFRTVCRAKMRGGKPIPMGLFVNLAEDARLAAETKKSKPAESEVSPTRSDTVEITDEMVLRLLKSPRHPDNQAILDRADPAQVARLKALLRRAQK